MKNSKQQKVVVSLEASQLITPRDLQEMLAYLKNFELKYRGDKIIAHPKK